MLEAFCQQLHIEFDRAVAAKALVDAEHNLAGDQESAWIRRLIEVGGSLQLRIRSCEVPFDVIWEMARERLPAATCVGVDESPEWLVLRRVRGSRVLVESVTGERWLTRRALLRELGLRRSSESRPWILAQAALPAGGEGRVKGDPHVHNTPLVQLWRFLRPEFRDFRDVAVFALLVATLALATPIAIEALVDTVAFGQQIQPIIVLALVLFSFLGFAALFRILMAIVSETVQRRLFVRLVEDLAFRLPRVSQSAWDIESGPELTNRYFEIATIQKVTAMFLLEGISLVLQAIVGMIVIAFYHPYLFGFDLVLIFLMVGVTRILGKGAVRSAINESRAKYELAAWLQEVARHTTAFKMHSGAQLALDHTDRLAVQYLDYRKQHFHVLLRQIAFSHGLQVIAGTVLLGLGGWLVIRGELTLGQLVAAELIVSLITASFAKFGKHLEGFYDLVAAVAKLGHLFDLPLEPRRQLFHVRSSLPGEFRAHRVTYAYGVGSPAIQDFSLHVAPGERLAILGGSGAGKSTLIDLLAGLRTPGTGHVSLDGMDLREIRPDSLREQIGMARGIEIFAGTIAENVDLGRHQLNAEDVRDGLRYVGLLDELLALPDGLATRLTAGGAPLSSGQAARLMIARAIVGYPRILLIDGTIDGLADDDLARVVGRMTEETSSWTLVLTTGRGDIARKFARIVRLPASASMPGASTISASCSDSKVAT